MKLNSCFYFVDFFPAVRIPPAISARQISFPYVAVLFSLFLTDLIPILEPENFQHRGFEALDLKKCFVGLSMYLATSFLT